MANYRAVKNGNWSDLTIWEDDSGGSYAASTVFPSTLDNVYSNTYVIQLNTGSISVNRLDTRSTTDVAASGQFEISTDVNIVCTDGIYATNTTLDEAAVTITAVCTASIESNLYAGYNRNHQALKINSDAYVDILGDIIMDVSGQNGASTLYNVGNATINIIGDIRKTSGDTGIPLAAMVLNGSPTVNITGDVFMSGGARPGCECIYINGGTTLTITGNITAEDANAILVTATAPPDITIIGNLIATTIAFAIQVSGDNGLIDITGNIIPNGAVPAVFSNSTSTIICRGNLSNSFNGIVPIMARKLVLDITPSFEWSGIITPSGLTSSLYSAENITAIPSSSTVIAGTTYGPNNELTGSYIVPDATNVRKGVLIGTTTGSAELTGADFLSALSSSSDPFAQRLRNVVTSEILGDQLTAFTP